jgi:TLC domain
MGGVIMFFFDWADPPLNIGKAILYLSLHKKDAFQSAANVCMGLFVVTFVVTRNVIFSYIVLHIVNLPDQDFSPSADTIVIYGIKGMLLVLVALMTYWLRMLIKVVYHQFVVNGGNVDDLREQPKHLGQSYSAATTDNEHCKAAVRSSNGIASHHQLYNKKQE